jgi:hypothetical protein
MHLVGYLYEDKSDVFTVLFTIIFQHNSQEHRCTSRIMTSALKKYVATGIATHE